MRKFLMLICFLTPVAAFCQRQEKHISIAFTNNHSAYPFGSFSKLISGPYHPGVELGYGFNWKTATKHDWYQDFHLGYFYHRFVQHAITVYSQGGYRFKPWKRVQFYSAIGLGYLHSIPATSVLELNDNGDYEKAKGLGRGQVMFNFSLGAGYMLTKKQNAPSLFLQYGQQLQAPFINAYVPLLPYNNIALGFSLPLKK